MQLCCLGSLLAVLHVSSGEALAEETQKPADNDFSESSVAHRVRHSSRGPLYSKLVHVSGAEDMAGVPFRVGNSTSRVRCEAPCDLHLTFREGEYGELTFETPRRHFSKSFYLTASSPDFDIQVLQGGNSKRLYGGIGLVTGGIPTLALGGFFWFAYYAAKTGGCDHVYMSEAERLHDLRKNRRERNMMAALGTAGTVIGLSSIILGSYWIHTGKSRIRIVPSAGPGAVSAEVSGEF